MENGKLLLSVIGKAALAVLLVAGLVGLILK